MIPKTDILTIESIAAELSQADMKGIAMPEGAKIRLLLERIRELEGQLEAARDGDSGDME